MFIEPMNLPLIMEKEIGGEAMLLRKALFTQIHAPVLIQLPEIWISQVFDEADRFAC